MDAGEKYADDTNEVVLEGALAWDVELKTARNGAKYAHFSVLVTRAARGADETKRIKASVPCSAWDRMAEELLGMGKGTRVRITGHLETYKSKETWRMEVRADMVTIVDARDAAMKDDPEAPASGDYQDDIPF